MTSQYTTSHKLEKPEEFTQTDAWAETVNTNMDKIDGRLGREVTLDMSSPLDYTLTTSETAVADTESFGYKLTGSMVISKKLIFPTLTRGIFYVRTSMSFNGHTLTISGGGGPSTVRMTTNGTKLLFVTSDGIQELPIPQAGTFLYEIRMYAGSVASLPPGWFVCNGSNGTPDLRNRFIKGASSVVGATGGSTSATTSSVSLNLTGETVPHTLTAAQMPTHKHFVAKQATVTNRIPVTPSNSFVDYFDSDGNAEQYRLQGNSEEANIGLSSNAGQGQPHSHEISLSNVGAHAHSVTLEPPFYTLMFIQYRG